MNPIPQISDETGGTVNLNSEYTQYRDTIATLENIYTIHYTIYNISSKSKLRIHTICTLYIDTIHTLDNIYIIHYTADPVNLNSE